MMLKKFIALTLLSFTTVLSCFAEKPLALVYVGPGACPNCWASAAIVAKKAGFKVRLVDGKHTPSSIFEKAKLWVQPGGKSSKAAKYMKETGLEKIRNFVKSGGGYVGFCAGGFLSTEKIGDSEKRGLGILPGTTKLYDPKDGPASMVDIQWNGQPRSVMFHGGPRFNLDGVSNSSVQILGTYDVDYGEGTIAGVSAEYGAGRVSVNGFHSEATRFWKFKNRMHDRDGSDQDLPIQMMKWAAHIQN